ncbi:MAG TPA: transposase family protein [Streptosporangiaceae bacterium]|nr:transposase family protein [Streptosporangiaceae bacterium]
MYASSLMEAVRCHLGAAGAPPALATSAQAVSLRQVLEGKLTDPRKPRGIRHSLASLVSVLVAGVACGYASILAIAVAAAGWDPEVLAAHGVRRNPQTGEHEPPSASTLGRVPARLDAGELEAGLSGWIAAAALSPRLAARIAARRSGRKKTRPGGAASPRPPKRRARPGLTAGCGPRPDIRGWTRRSPATPAMCPPARRWPSTARNASSPRPPGRPRCTCWARSPTSPAW